MCLSWLGGGSRSEFGVSHIILLGKVVWRVQKLDHHCALNHWKGSGRELGEDKEGSWIWSKRPDCD